MFNICVLLSRFMTFACCRLALRVVTVELINSWVNISQPSRDIVTPGNLLDAQVAILRLASRWITPQGIHLLCVLRGPGMCLSLPFKYPLTYGRNLVRSELLHNQRWDKRRILIACVSLFSFANQRSGMILLCYEMQRAVFKSDKTFTRNV